MNEEQHEVEVQEVPMETETPEMATEVANHDVEAEHQESQNEVSNKEYNFQQLRKKTESLEKMNEELARKIAPYEEKVSQSSQPSIPPEDSWGLDDDELVEGRHIKTYIQELKGLKQAYAMQAEEAKVNKLKSQFPDIEKVITPDNIQKFQTAEPELYESLMSGKDTYKKGVSMYKTLKALGYANPETDAVAERIAHNKSKPGTSNAIKSPSALSYAPEYMGLTEERKKQLYKEMIESAKRY